MTIWEAAAVLESAGVWVCFMPRINGNGRNKKTVWEKRAGEQSEQRTYSREQERGAGSRLLLDSDIRVVRLAV